MSQLFHPETTIRNVITINWVKQLADVFGDLHINETELQKSRLLRVEILLDIFPFCWNVPKEAFCLLKCHVTSVFSYLRFYSA